VTRVGMPGLMNLGDDPLGAAASLERLRAKAGLADAPAAAKAAKDFEAVLLHRLLEVMRRTIQKADVDESGAGEQVESLFWYYLAQDMADKGGLGLAKELARRMGEAGAEPPAAALPEVEA
jgi:Rod binding domain-containing protein